MADGTQIELPGAAYFKVVARFGRWTSDGGDPDEFPDRVTTGGTVKLSIDTTDQLVRVREADGGWRLEEVAEREYIVSASGELLNPQSGNVGVWLIDTSNPAIDPQHATYQATITTPSGKTRTLHFNQESAAGGVVDLVGAVSMDPVFGEAQLDGRVTALESRVALIEGGVPGMPAGVEGDVLTWVDGAWGPAAPSGGGGGGVTDHGALTGLTDDDHPQYALADGTRGDFASTNHGHALADISDYTAPDLSGLVADDDPRLSDARTPTAHNHDDRYYTDAEADALLAAKSDDGHTHSQYVESTDVRLSDARTPTTHDHSIADVTGLQDALDGKQPAGSYATTTALAAGLADKADATHSHVLADVTDYTPPDLSSYAPSTQPINAQTGTTYTLVASDAGKLVTLTNAAAITLTVPGSVFTTGQRVDCLVLGEGMVTVTGSGATVNGTPSLVSRAQYSAFSVVFTSATTAVIVGDLA